MTHKGWRVVKPQHNQLEVLLNVWKVKFVRRLCFIFFQPVTSSAACILARVVDRQQDAAQPLVKIFLHSGKLVPFIQRLAEHEIKRTA